MRSSLNSQISLKVGVYCLLFPTPLPVWIRFPSSDDSSEQVSSSGSGEESLQCANPKWRRSKLILFLLALLVVPAAMLHHNSMCFIEGGSFAVWGLERLTLT